MIDMLINSFKIYYFSNIFGNIISLEGHHIHFLVIVFLINFFNCFITTTTTARIFILLFLHIVGEFL